MIAATLGRLGIPLAPEASVPLAMTATGSSLFELLAIVAGEGTAATVVSLLRRPARARPDQVDWLERAVLRGRMQSAEEALSEWAGTGESPRRIWALDALREAGDDREAIAGALTRIAADVAERPHARSGLVPSGAPAIELRAATEVARALAEVVGLGDLAPHGPAELAELLTHVRVPLWRGPTEGRVRILSPYRLRATRVAHLFVAGLADGSFPAGGGGDPLLSDERRRALGLLSRSDPAAEERYLFYTCVSKPDRCLHLSYPASDEAGGTAPRSAFVDEVRDLLAPAPTPDPADDPLEPELIERATLADFVPAPEDASAPHDLARALAAVGPDAEERAAALDLPEGAAERAVSAVAAARRRVRAARAPGPISHPDILASLAAHDLFGASTLEEYHLCSYRWFVNHELDPRRIEPDPEPLENGGIVHATLERLFGEPPGEGARPTPETVGRWIERAHGIVREVAVERGWDLEAAAATISLARLDAVLSRYLRRDAETGGPLMPDPDLLEAGFGDRPGDRFPAADLGEFRLRGAIDRIDVKDRYALIRDYKLSAKVTAGAALLREGKLQLPLYMLAARGFGLEPIGGLYSPLGASKEDRPRGLLDKEHKSTLIPGETSAHYGTDFKDPEGLEEILDQALERGDPRRRRDPRRPDRSQPSGRLLPDLVRIRSDLPGRARDPRAGRGRGGGRGLMDGPEQLSFEAPPAEDPPSPAAQEPEPEREPPPASEPGRAPTEQQQLAIDNRDRDVFLEAGAGTGKTRVLVDRYCEAIDADEIEPDRILAFTFTEKAAAEMRRRVRVELSRRAAAAGDPGRRTRLQEAARAGESAPITTIHGFCRRLLATHPVAAGLDPRFRVLDADEASRIARSSFDEALAALAAGRRCGRIDRGRLPEPARLDRPGGPLRPP